MHKLLSSPVRSVASCLLAVLAHGAIRAGEGALDQNPGLYSYSQLQPSSYRRQHHPLNTSVPRGVVDTLRGGANPNNRRRKHPSRAVEQQPGVGSSGSGGASTPEAIEISGAELSDSSSRNGSGGRAKQHQHQQQHIDGIYLREWDVNGAPHFKRRSKVSLCCIIAA